MSKYTYLVMGEGSELAARIWRMRYKLKIDRLNSTGMCFTAFKEWHRKENAQYFRRGVQILLHRRVRRMLFLYRIYTEADHIQKYQEQLPLTGGKNPGSAGECGACRPQPEMTAAVGQ